MALICPIKGFLDDCRELAAFIDDINDQAKHLDIELAVLNRQSYRGEEASPAALQVLQEIKELTKQNNIELSEVRDENRNYDQLLRMTLEQVKSLHAETTEYEQQHMTQYGFNVPPPLDPSLFDIFKVEAPGAAVDLEPEDDGEDGVDQEEDQELIRENVMIKKLASVPNPVSVVEMDDLSIFDLGLSKDTLRMLTGVGKSEAKKSDDPSKSTNVGALIPGSNAIKPSTLETLGGNCSLNIDRQEAEMDTNNMAPILKLCNNFTANLDMSVGGSPALNPRNTRSSTNNYLGTGPTQQIEISPGLYTTRSVRKEAERVSGNTEEIVNSIINSNINQCNTPKSKPGQLSSSNDLPETPELQTVNLKALLSKAAEKERNRNAGSIMVTEDSPQLSPRLQPSREKKDEDRLSNLPGTPQFETFNMKSFREKKEVVSEESPLLTPELESFNKKEAFDLEMPLTPELETVNLRQLLQKKRFN